MVTDQERKRIAKEFFDKAISRKLIVFKIPAQFTPKTKKIHNNIQKSAFAYHEFQKLFDDKIKLKRFCAQNKKIFGIEEIHSKRLIQNFFLHHALNYIEAYKLFLLEILKHGIKIGKRNFAIGPTMSLGTLVVSLCQELRFNDFEKLFTKEFRNILGHSSWWWVRDSIAYEQNGTGHVMPLTYFNKLMADFGKNMDELVAEYMRRFTK